MQNLPSILSPDLGLLVWMLLAFLVVFLLLWKYGFPVIIKMVDERKTYIDDSLKNAREANNKLANIKAESDAILKEAREKQAQILQEAMATRDTIIKDARDKAQAEGHKLLEEAKGQIGAEKESALRDIRSVVADLSIEIAQKVMRRQLDNNAEQAKFVERMISEVSNQK